MQRASLIFLTIALLCLPFADLEITTVNPWTEMGRLGLGLLTPDFFATDQLLESLLNTLAFALIGVALANVFGLQEPQEGLGPARIQVVEHIIEEQDGLFVEAFAKVEVLG